jgi:5-(carboxyamino)imidazole ribonucleotide synthase
MSIMSAQRMGLRCLSLDPAADSPASQIANSVPGDLTDSDKVAEIFRQCEFITLENEFIPSEIITSAMKEAGRDESCLTPGAPTLGMIQDKLVQRECYERAGVPSPRAVEAHLGSEMLGFPHVLKARFGGYDGKGTRTVKTQAGSDALRETWESAPWLAEGFVPFQRELAVMVCRSRTETWCFPTMETVQTNHVCDLVFPSGIDASEVALRAVEAVQGFGLFGVELFETATGEIIVNEIAPRPHNSGHFSLDWGGVSQFEQHVRLTLGLPLSRIVGQECCMANLLGIGEPGSFEQGIRAAVDSVPHCQVHWYGKSEAKVGRKVGHINVAGRDCVALAQRARNAFWEGFRLG